MTSLMKMLIEANNINQWYGKVSEENGQPTIVVPSSIIAQEVKNWATKNNVVGGFKVNTLLKDQK